jgi:hypothetical protein
MINPLNHFNKKIPMKLVFLLAATFTLLSSPLAANQAFATHLSEDVKWQLVFISSKGCSLHNYQMLTQYDEITEKYLERYELNSAKYNPICLPESEYVSDYEPPHDLDLVILVYDKNLGEKVLHAQKMGGLYSHTGSDRSLNHVIMFCDCSNFYYSDPVWILTHELSHFVLYYKNYQMSVIEDLIHANDAKYDKCRETGLNCGSFVDKLEIESSTRIFSVMPIYKPDSTGLINSETDEAKVRTSVIGISKMITKWWAAEKITDGDYANAIGYLVDSDILPSDGSQITLSDDPLDDSPTWQDKFAEINENLRGSQANDKTNSNGHDSETTPLSKTIFVEQVILGLPDWFKTTAGWWAQEKITDQEFKKNIQYLVRSGIIRPHSTDIFDKVINEEKTLIESSLQKIITDIKSINDLNKNDNELLVNKINLAIKKFDFGDSKAGCQQLDEFIEYVSDFVDHETINSANGQKLINSADLVKLNFC